MSIQANTLLALAALCGASLGQTPSSRTPAAPPSMADIKAPSTLVVHKTPAPESNKPGVSNASAESPAKSAVAAPHQRVIDPTQLFTSVDETGTVWVRGANYKASFDASGASFIPFFGSKAPQNYPVTFHVAGAHVGGAPLAIETNVLATEEAKGLSFQRGGLVERYDLAPQSIEQSFVFASLPAGELTLKLQVESDLVGVQDADGIRFANELGHVAYGRATVLDAHGERLELETILDGSELTLRVPADFLAGASFPITIDPVITVFALDHSAIDDYLPDVAYDPSTGHYLTVEEEWFSVSDHDVYSVMTNSIGTIISGGYADYTTAYWANPRIANNAYSSQFMVVAAVGLGGSIAIRATSTSATNVVFGTSFQVSGAEFGSKINPDIGGDPTFAPPSYYLVTWERNFSGADHDIHAALVDPSNAVIGSTIYIDNTLATIDTNPRISKCDGQAPFASSDWTIVWSHEAAGNDHDIYAARVRWDGSLTSAFVIDSTNADDFNMHVSAEQDDHGGLRRYMVCSQRYVGSDWDVMAWVYDAASYVTSLDLSSIDNINFYYQNQYTPAVDCDGTKFAVVFSEQYLTSTTDNDTYISTFELAGNTLLPSEVHNQLGYTTDNESNPSLTTQHLIGSPSTVMGVWETYTAAGGGDTDGGLYMTTVATSFCSPGTDAINCPCGNNGLTGRGCDNSVASGGALLEASGTTNIDTLVLSAQAMLPSANAIYLQGDTYLGSGFAFGDGVRCAGGQLLRLALKQSVGGASIFPDASVGDPSITARCAALGSPIVPGSQRFYQTYYRDPASFACATTYNITNAIVINW